MTDTAIQNGSNGAANGFKPPYGSFVTMNNLFDRMAEEGGIPARIDRSYLSNLPNSVIATTTHALKALGLTDDDLRPAPALVEMIENPEQRKSILAGIIKEKYGPQLALGGRATTAQLVESFKETGVTGSTVRKAIAFFLAAARWAEVPISPYFKTPKPLPSERRVTRKLVDPAPEPTPAAPERPADPVKGLDPFIQGLVRSLPEPGAVFPQEMRQAWFTTAAGIFDLIYKLDPQPKGGSSD